MDKKKVVIIGAGAAGLSAGCYLRMNGYDTHIFEMAVNAGGVATTWKRNGFTFDGATNWLPGSKPVTNFHAVLREILDFSGLQFVNFDEFVRIEGPGREVFHVYTDADRLRREMERIAPEDGKVIGEFTSAVKKIGEMRLPVEKAPELLDFFDVIKLAGTSLPLLLFFSKWKKTAIGEYAQEFTNATLREMFLQIFPSHDFFSVLSLIMSLGWMHVKSAGYPLGGSGKIVSLLCDTYRRLEGAISFNSKVKEILVDDGSACGLLLENGDKFYADIVVSAADAYHTFFSLLKSQYATAEITGRFKRFPLFPSFVQVSLGVNRSFDDEIHKIVLPLKNPLTLGEDAEIKKVMVRICNFDPGCAPKGKTAIVAHLRTGDSAYWEDLRSANPELYKREKDRVAFAVVETLEGRFGGIVDKIEASDVATPATYVRYTGNLHGSYQGWAPVPRLIGRSFKKTIPGLRNFYMTGQWVDPPGGLPRVIISARNTTQIICRDDGKKFRTS